MKDRSRPERVKAGDPIENTDRRGRGRPAGSADPHADKGNAGCVKSAGIRAGGGAPGHDFRAGRELGRECGNGNDECIREEGT